MRTSTSPRHEGAVTSLVESAGHPTRCLISWTLDVATVHPAAYGHDGRTRTSDKLLVSRRGPGEPAGSRGRNHRGRDPLRATGSLARSLAPCADRRADRGRSAPTEAGRADDTACGKSERVLRFRPPMPLQPPPLVSCCNFWALWVPVIGSPRGSSKPSCVSMDA